MKSENVEMGGAPTGSSPRTTPVLIIPRVWPRWAARGALVLLCLLVFGASVGYEFQDLDDHVNLRDHPWLRPLTVENLSRIWKRPYVGLYAPVTYTYFAMLAAVGDRLDLNAAGSLDPRLFHLGNVLWHTTAVVLVFELLGTLTRRITGAFAGAALFAVHPLHVESVAWVTEAKGLIAATLSLASLVLIMPRTVAIDTATDDSMGPSLAVPPRFGHRGRGFVAHYIAASSAYFLALLAKPSAAVVPAVWLVLAARFFPGSWRRAATFALPWFAAAIALLAFTKLSLQADEALAPGISSTTLVERTLIAGDALAFYIQKTVLPWGLVPDYDRSPLSVALQRTHWLGWLVVFAAIAPAFTTRGRCLAWGTAIAVFVVCLSPVLGWIPFGFQQYSTVADRYAYLAMLGPAILFAQWSSGMRDRGSNFARAAAFGIIACAAGLALWQLRAWRDTPTLFARNARIVPTSFLAHEKLGAWHARRRDWPPAEAEFRSACRHHPSRAELHNKLGHVLASQGKAAEAESEFILAIVLDPRAAEPLYNLGNQLAGRNELVEAERRYRRAIALRPDYAAAYNNLGVLQLRGGRSAEAAISFEQACTFNPADGGAWLNYSGALANAGRRADAVNACRRALELQPSNADAMNKLAWFLATASDPLLRRGSEAVALARRVCELSGYRQATGLDTLAAALASDGQFDQAQVAAEQAEHLARDRGQSALAKRIAARRERYRRRQAYYEP